MRIDRVNGGQLGRIFLVCLGAAGVGLAVWRAWLFGYAWWEHNVFPAGPNEKANLLDFVAIQPAWATRSAAIIVAGLIGVFISVFITRRRP